MEVLNLATKEKQDEILDNLLNDSVNVASINVVNEEKTLIDIEGSGVLINFFASHHQATTTASRFEAEILIDGQDLLVNPVLVDSTREGTSSSVNLPLNIKFNSSLVIKIRTNGTYSFGNAQIVYKLV